MFVELSRAGSVVGISVERDQRFESVVTDLYEPLQRYFGRRADANDVSELLNDALLVIWRRLDDVPATDIRPWAYGIAKHCLDNQRRGDRRRLRLVGRLAAEPRTTVHPRDLNPPTPLDVALAELDPADRELVRLWAWERLEPREIAVTLDTTANAVSLRLTRVKKKLAASIERQDRPPAGHEGLGHSREVES